MPATAAVIVSKANAWARSARATPAGGCRRLLALNWPLTGTITRQRSISGEHIWLIVSVEVESSRHRPTRTTKMAADQSARRTRPPEVVHGYQERIEQTRWSPVRRIRPERQLPRSCLLYTSPSPRDRQNLVCRLLLEKKKKKTQK